ncbi:MAG: thioredoxin family protein [Deltaproteobacteria bacterium]|jgi:thioredoxin-related protein|nr:thioredoxin family protein [Deltaproteobacteria bacterium]
MKKTLVILGAAVLSILILALAVRLALKGGADEAAAETSASDRDSSVIAAASASISQAERISPPADFPGRPADLKLYSLDEALAEAKSAGKFVLVYFWTSWCPNCEIFNTQVIPDPRVLRSLKESYLFVSIDGDDDPAKLGRIFKVRGYPTIYILSKDQEPALVIPGRVPADTFAHVLTYISTGADAKMEFDEYEESLT